jgi:hypothetical protein
MSWSFVWTCAARSHPTCSRNVGRRTGQDSWIPTHWAVRLEAACVIHWLVCMSLQTVIPSVHSLALERWHSSGWRKNKTYQDVSRNLVSHGKCHLNSLRSYKRPPATCTCYLPSQLRWTSSGMSCSVRFVEKGSQVNSLLVRIATSCMSLQSQPFVVNSTHWGWMTDEDSKLVINRMWGSPAPVIQLLSCKCVQSCILFHCTHLSNGLECMDLQKCQWEPSEEEPVAKLSDSESDVNDIEQ